MVSFGTSSQFVLGPYAPDYVDGAEHTSLGLGTMPLACPSVSSLSVLWFACFLLALLARPVGACLIGSCGLVCLHSGGRNGR